VHNHLFLKCYSYVYLNLLFLFKTFSTFLKVVVGLPVGNLPDTINFVSIQFHFDNSDGDDNKVDNGTGIKEIMFR